MLRYNVNRGVSKIKTKTTIAISVFMLTASGAGIAVAVPAISHAAGWSDHFPGNNGTSCNAWHGAPGGLGKNSPYYWVQSEVNDGNTLPNGSIAPSGGANFGQEQGVITGQNNSGFSASCNL